MMLALSQYEKKLLAPFYFMCDFIILFVRISLITIIKNIEYITQAIH
jgi:CHASE3 domain sensor protein